MKVGAQLICIQTACDWGGPLQCVDRQTTNRIIQQGELTEGCLQMKQQEDIQYQNLRYTNSFSYFLANFSTW